MRIDIGTPHNAAINQLYKDKLNKMAQNQLMTEQLYALVALCKPKPLEAKLTSAVSVF